MLGIELVLDERSVDRAKNKLGSASRSGGSQSSGAVPVGGDRRERKERKNQTKVMSAGFGGMIGMLSGIGLTIGALLATFRPILEILKFVEGFIKVTLGALLKLIYNIILLVFMGIKWLIDWFVKAFNDPYGMIIEPIWEFMKSVGKWLWNNIIVPGWNFIKGVGKLIWDYFIAPGWNIIKGVGAWLWNNIIVPGWNILKAIGQWLWTNIIVAGFNILLGIGSWIWTNILVAGFNILLNAGNWLWTNIILAGFNVLRNVGVWIWTQLIRPAWEFVSTKFRGLGSVLQGIINVFNGIRNAVSSLLSRISNIRIPFIGGGSSKSVNDALIMNDGRIIEFNPNDNILAFQGDMPSMRGDNTSQSSSPINITVNGYVGDEQELAERISKVLERLNRGGGVRF
jgi:hypothetical protein